MKTFRSKILLFSLWIFVGALPAEAKTCLIANLVSGSQCHDLTIEFDSANCPNDLGKKKAQSVCLGKNRAKASLEVGDQLWIAELKKSEGAWGSFEWSFEKIRSRSKKTQPTPESHANSHEKRALAAFTLPPPPRVSKTPESVSLNAVAAPSAPSAPSAPAAPVAPATVSTSTGGFAGSIKLTSNYIWRGLTFSNNNPALQGQASYEHSSGLWVGLAGSNLFFGDMSITPVPTQKEVDALIGYKGSFEGASFNLYFTRYQFIDPGAAAFSANDFGLNLAYEAATFDMNFLPNWFGYNTSSLYLHGGYVLPIVGSLRATLGVGYSFFGQEARTQDSAGTIKGTGFSNYLDYGIGLQFHKADDLLELLFTNTNRVLVSPDGSRGDSAGDRSFTVSLTRSF